MSSRVNRLAMVGALLTAASVLLLAFPYILSGNYGSNSYNAVVQTIVIVCAVTGSLLWLTVNVFYRKGDSQIIQKYLDSIYVFTAIIGGFIYLLIEDALVYDMQTYIFFTYIALLTVYIVTYLRAFSFKRLLMVVTLLAFGTYIYVAGTLGVFGTAIPGFAALIFIVLYGVGVKDSIRKAPVLYGLTTLLALPFLLVIVTFPVESIDLYETDKEHELEAQQGIESLADIYSDSFDVGVAVPHYFIENEAMIWTVNHHFSSLTAENVMKPIKVLDDDNRGSYDFTEADRLVGFADNHNKNLRGHTMIWHNQTPDWFFREDFSDEGELVSREVMLGRMENHIKEVAEHFDGSELYAWDVVNEAVEIFDENGMRNSYWLQIIGDDYIEKAFEYARKYTEGQDVSLFYNDFGLYGNEEKRQLVVTLVEDLNQKGLIDGVGLQSHVGMHFPTANQVNETIRLFGDMGLEVQITELDINIYNTNGGSARAVDEDLFIEQAYRYRELFDVFESNSHIISNVTFWGLADHQSWLNWYPARRNNWPLLFDSNLQAKPAYYALVDSEYLTKDANYNLYERIEKSVLTLLDID